MLENKFIINALWKTQGQCKYSSLIGFLPIEVSNAVSDIQASQNEAPPPLPPRISDDEDTPQPSPPGMQQPPPVPVKKARHIT